jgi:NADP-dependent 3-hydroxy acid dehydrogenase YdfG
MARQPRSLAGRVAAVTGAARGIGRATAEALVREGMQVAIGDLDAALAERTAQEIGTVAFALDVTDRGSFDRFVARVEEALGPIDVLVNNAGIMPLGPFVEEDDLTARRMVDVNVHGVLHGMKAVLPAMLARDSGHLVNMASSVGKGGLPGGATYSGTKHFVIGVSEAVHFELRGTGIDVSVVMPGVVNTELAAGLGGARGVRRVGPDEVAAAIVAALRRPRFDVYVPRALGPIYRVAAALPRGGRDAASRLFGADRVLAGADRAARRGYELRAARSDPGLEPGDERRPLTGAGR